MLAQPPHGERLQKVLAAAGFGSRRACEELITKRMVRVNDRVASLGCRVDPEVDRITVDGVPVATKAGLVYWLLNKPRHVVTTMNDPHGRPTVADFVPVEPRVYPVGRLDFDSEGLLLMTNDGELTHRLTHPRYGVEKEYLVEVQGKVTPQAIAALRNGVELEDGMTAPAVVGQLGESTLRITIHEGRNRQIRRMCEHVGVPVKRLVRTRIGPLRSAGLKPGTRRKLTLDEIRALASAVRTSSNPS